MHTHSLVSLDNLFSTFRGSRLLNILPKNFSPRLAITTSSFSKNNDLFQPTVNQVQGCHSHGCITLLLAWCISGYWSEVLDYCTLYTVQCYVFQSCRGATRCACGSCLGSKEASLFVWKLQVWFCASMHMVVFCTTRLGCSSTRLGVQVCGSCRAVWELQPCLWVAVLAVLHKNALQCHPTESTLHS